MQLPELRTIALAIINNATSGAWSLDQGILFFDGRFYIPASSPLLPDLLETLLLCGHTENLRLLAVGFYTPPLMSAATYNFPASILLTHQWPQGIVPAATTVFFDDTTNTSHNDNLPPHDGLHTPQRQQ